jgi:hypothetical protein
MLKFKRGDSVSWPTKYSVGGVPQDLTNYTIESQARNKDGVLVCTFTVTKLDQGLYPGCYLISLTPEQSAVPRPGSYFQDIQYSVGTEVRSTNSTPLVIEPDQTQPV